MHFSSKVTGGYRIYAVTGINTVSFAIDFREADTKGLLGFAVEREDEAENERYFMLGMKVFEKIVPHPSSAAAVSTFNHPVQSFVWDDFTAKPEREYVYYFHPIKGKPKNLDRSAPAIRIAVKTEPLYTEDDHDVFFNRGVASSQAYRREFDNLPPDKIEDPVKRHEALEWLSRKLDDALIRFIDSAQKGDTLLGCFYEFRYAPALEKLRDAVEREVDVRLIVDGKVNEHTDKKGKFHESFPREENKRAVKAAKLQKSAVKCWREGNPSDIQHNKFLVLLRKNGDGEVWTGSTNLSVGGVHGQTNVGHWIRDTDLANAFAAYWELLVGDPGSEKGDSKKDGRAKKGAYRDAVAELGSVPERWKDIPQGSSAIFSPRSGSGVLEMYATLLDEAANVGCATLAFGISKVFKERLADNTSKSQVTFLLLEKEDKEKARAKDPFVPLTTRQNVYQAWGSYLHDPLYQWTRETSARALGLNTHVSYIHSKFMLHDPLGEDPIVVTGSANFSDASTNDNDENMVLIRGNQRVADIYFTEFNRLFNHYYFRSVQEKLHREASEEANASADAKSSVFLDETDGWLAKYKRGSLRWKRVEIYARMANAKIL